MKTLKPEIRDRIWEHKETLDWFWVEKRDGKYYGENIDCADVGPIFEGNRRPPFPTEEINIEDYRLTTEDDIRNWGSFSY